MTPTIVSPRSSISSRSAANSVRISASTALVAEVGAGGCVSGRAAEVAEAHAQDHRPPRPALRAHAARDASTSARTVASSASGSNRLVPMAHCEPTERRRGLRLTGRGSRLWQPVDPCRSPRRSPAAIRSRKTRRRRQPLGRSRRRTRQPRCEAEAADPYADAGAADRYADPESRSRRRIPRCPSRRPRPRSRRRRHPYRPRIRRPRRRAPRCLPPRRPCPSRPRLSMRRQRLWSPRRTRPLPKPATQTPEPPTATPAPEETSRRAGARGRGGAARPRRRWPRSLTAGAHGDACARADRDPGAANGHGDLDRDADVDAGRGGGGRRTAGHAAPPLEPVEPTEPSGELSRRRRPGDRSEPVRPARLPSCSRWRRRPARSCAAIRCWPDAWRPASTASGRRRRDGSGAAQAVRSRRPPDASSRGRRRRQVAGNGQVTHPGSMAAMVDELRRPPGVSGWAALVGRPRRAGGRSEWRGRWPCQGRANGFDGSPRADQAARGEQLRRRHRRQARRGSELGGAGPRRPGRCSRPAIRSVRPIGASAVLAPAEARARPAGGASGGSGGIGGGFGGDLARAAGGGHGFEAGTERSRRLARAGTTLAVGSTDPATRSRRAWAAGRHGNGFAQAPRRPARSSPRRRRPSGRRARFNVPEAQRANWRSAWTSLPGRSRPLMDREWRTSGCRPGLSPRCRAAASGRRGWGRCPGACSTARSAAEDVPLPGLPQAAGVRPSVLRLLRRAAGQDDGVRGVRIQESGDRRRSTPPCP